MYFEALGEILKLCLNYYFFKVTKKKFCQNFFFSKKYILYFYLKFNLLAF
jgi:hypothetical protein